jgi:ribosomal protein S18 acetylase RimI-like enzyme
MTTVADYEYVYSNLIEAMRFFGHATPKSEIRELDQAVAIFSGIEYGVFNICLLDNMPRDAAGSLDECARYFGKHARRWSIWVCEDAHTPAGRRELRAALSRHELREISRAPGMIADQFTAPRRKLPAIECIRVDNQKLREAFGGIAATCFDIPTGVAREVYNGKGAWSGSYHGYMGMVAGRPVGIVALVRNDDTLGVYSLGVEPESRRLGYGEALLREAVEQARAERTFERVVLQSSESGHSLYRRLGFREAAKFTVYLTK